MTTDQLRYLTAAAPAGLECPAAAGSPECRALIAERWPTLPPLDRFVVVRMFGRSVERQLVEPCMMLLRQWGVFMREVVEAVSDPDVRKCCLKKLDYVNREK